MHLTASPLITINDYQYNPKDIIGRGYSSTVYKGVDTRTQQLVAIKVVDMKLLEDELHRELLGDEIKALEMLKDTENVVRLLNVTREATQTYIVTEFCEAKDLAVLIRGKKSMSDQNIIGIVRQLVSGYLALWKKGIVHRDLKPANILIKQGIIKLADFGFVAWYDNCSQPFNYNVGSPSYMAPEALKRNVYSYKSDIWALGVIVFELTFGRVPWRNSNDMFLYQMLMNEPIKGLMEKERPVHPALMEFVLGCCVPNVEERMTPEEIMGFDWESEAVNRRPAAKSMPESGKQRKAGLHEYMKQTRNKSQMTTASTTAAVLFQSKNSGTSTAKPVSGTTTKISVSPQGERKSALADFSNYPNITIPTKISIPTCNNIYYPSPSPHVRAPSHYIATSPNAAYNPMTSSSFFQSPTSALFKSSHLSPFPVSPSHNPLLPIRATSPPAQLYPLPRASSPPLNHPRITINPPQPSQTPPHSNPHTQPTRPFQQLNRLNELSTHAEQCIMSQIQYCRFINVLLREVSGKENLKVVRCLKSQLLKKIGMLNDMASNQQNVFQLRGFYWLAASQRWPPLRTLIQKYYDKYNVEYQESRVAIFDEFALVENIKILFKMGSITDTELLQKLVTYLQLKQLQQKLDYNDFSDQSKIDLLVDRQPFTDANRLKSRMQVLGLC